MPVPRPAGRMRSRRDFLKKGLLAGAGAAALYVAPSLTTVSPKPAYASMTGAATPTPTPVPCLVYGDPSSGAVGAGVIIEDSCGRIQAGDTLLFYLPGDDPAGGTPAVGVAITGTHTISGSVPNVPNNNPYLIAVRPGADHSQPSRFPDLSFFVA